MRANFSRELWWPEIAARGRSQRRLPVTASVAASTITTAAISGITFVAVMVGIAVSTSAAAGNASGWRVEDVLGGFELGALAAPMLAPQLPHHQHDQGHDQQDCQPRFHATTPWWIRRDQRMAETLPEYDGVIEVSFADSACRVGCSTNLRPFITARSAAGVRIHTSRSRR